MAKNSYPKVSTRLLAAPTNVVANGTAQLDLPLGSRYKGLYLVYAGTAFTPALMTGIRVYANQQIFHNLSGTRRDTINQFDGMQAAANKKVLYIPFHRVGLAAKPQEFMTYLNTDVKCPQAPSGIKSLQLQVDIGAATAPALTVYADICDNDAEQGEALLRAETWFENNIGVGDYTHLHKYSGDPKRPLITRFGFWDTDTDISSFYFEKNQAMMNQRTSPLNEFIQTADNEVTKVTQSGVVIFDTAEQGNHRDTLNVRNIADFEVHTVHTATNASMPVTVESLGTL